MGMKLILELVPRDGRSPEGEPRKEFGAEGGRIGRASDCEWVLSSAYISRYHASICCTDGVFYIVSTGENGVALNDSHAWLPQLEHRALRDGDRLFIDEYEITVRVPGDGTAVAPLATPGSFAAPTPSLRTEFDLDRFSGLMPAVATSAVGERRAEVAWNHSSGLVDHFAPPAVPAVQAGLPADWDDMDLQPPAAPAVQSMLPPARRVTSASAPLPPPPPQESIGASSASSASNGLDLAAFLRSAGVEPDSVTPEMTATLGCLLRSLVQGLVEALRTRSDFRGEFRLPVTRVRMSENNPLKFAVDADDALSTLLRRRDERYLGPLEAVEDAFDDIRAHHLAISAAMRSGFESVLNRFDPRKLAQDCDKRARHNAGWPIPTAMRYWREYVQLFETLADDTDSAFRRLFGEPFAQAYERQLDSSRRRRAKPPLVND